MKRNVLILAALFVVCTAWSVAFADDAKLYPGSMAVRKDITQPTPYIELGMAINHSMSNWLLVHLPIIHDSINYGIKSGSVKVLDMHYSLNIKCSLCSVSRNNNYFAGYGSPTKYSDGYCTTTQTLTFDAPPGATSDTIYFYECDIPPYLGNGSGIFSYRLDELGHD